MAKFKRNTWANLAEAQGAPRRFHNKEEREANRRALTVAPASDLEWSNSPLFSPATGALSNLSDEELSALDSLIDSRGLSNVLKALQGLLESRIEDGTMSKTGCVLLHLSRQDANARAAERLRDLAYNPDFEKL